MPRRRKHPGAAPPKGTPEYRDWWVEMYCPYLLPPEPEREPTLKEYVQDFHERVMRGIRIPEEKNEDD